MDELRHNEIAMDYLECPEPIERVGECDICFHEYPLDYMAHVSMNTLLIIWHRIGKIPAGSFVKAVRQVYLISL